MRGFSVANDYVKEQLPKWLRAVELESGGDRLAAIESSAIHLGGTLCGRDVLDMTLLAHGQSHGNAFDHLNHAVQTHDPTFGCRADDLESTVAAGAAVSALLAQESKSASVAAQGILSANWLGLSPAVTELPELARATSRRRSEALRRRRALPRPRKKAFFDNVPEFDDTEVPVTQQEGHAATIAGHAHAAIEVSGLSTALLSAARARNFAAATALLEASTWTNAAKVAAENAEIALLLGAISGDRSVPELGAALEARRDDIDGTWLKAAAVAISQPDPPAGSMLEIVFGPLHHAITDDRLPSECWEFLNRVLPEAPDPALRLRRFLVRVAKEKGWRQNKYRRALRGAGPYATELYREFDDEDPLRGRIRKFIESLRAS